MSPRERVTRHLRAVCDHPKKSPWVFWPLGLLTMAFAGVMMYREPENWKAWTGLGMFGAAIVPGLLPFAVDSLKPLVGLFKTYKGNGGGSQTSDGNSP